MWSITSHGTNRGNLYDRTIKISEEPRGAFKGRQLDVGSFIIPKSALRWLTQLDTTSPFHSFHQPGDYPFSCNCGSGSRCVQLAWGQSWIRKYLKARRSCDSTSHIWHIAVNCRLLCTKTLLVITWTMTNSVSRRKEKKYTGQANIRHYYYLLHQF